MAHNDKDRLADLLGQMADGQHDEEPAADGHEQVDVHGGPSSAPAAPQPARPASRPAASVPTPQPALPRTAETPPAAQGNAPRPAARPAPVVVPRPAAPRPMARPLPDTPPVRQAASPGAAPPPTEQELGVSNEPVDEDDQVIVPAPPVETLAHSPVHRPRQAVRPALNVEVKRTMIPVLLTIGVVCIAVVILGMAAEAESPFRVFRELWFAAPVTVIGLLFLAGAIFTMFQVRNELQRQTAGGRA